MDYRELLGELFEGAYIVDDERKIIFWNSEAERITGYGAEEMIGKRCYENILRHVDDKGHQLCHEGCPLLDTIEHGRTNRAQVYLHHREGYRVPVLVKTMPFVDPLDDKPKALEIFTDAPDPKSVKQKYKQLQKSSVIDTLTGTYNRSFLEYQLDLCQREYGVFQTSFAVLFIDIDRFKHVNDTHGHAAGDAVLRTIAKTMQANVRKDDIVGRWGGEEFIIILRHVDHMDARMVAEKHRMLIKDTHVSHGQQTLQVTVSIGGAMYREGLGVEKLIEIADGNMYTAKKQGRNRVVMDNPM